MGARRATVPVAIVLSLIAALPAAARAAMRLKPGDVLIADLTAKHGAVIDRYRPSDGSFAIFSDNAISTKAGGHADLGFPIGIAFDSKGRVLVADRESHGGGIIMINQSTGAQRLISDNKISVAAGGSAAFNEPSGIAVDGSGTIYVSELGSNSVVKVNPKTGAARVISHDTKLKNPFDLALSGGDAFVVSNYKIVRVSLPGGAQHRFVTGHGLKQPGWIVSAPHGVFLVADSKAEKLYSVNKSTGTVSTVSADPQLKRPFGVGVGLDGFDYVSDYRARALFRISPKTGKAKPVVGRSQLTNPLGVAVVPR